MQLSELTGTKILLGITGGIAAYKALFLIRLLVRSGAEVKVLLTPAALDFITPLTASTLSKNPVVYRFTTGPNDELWQNHVELALWADLMVVAPATANTLSKMASGQSDNILTATYLSLRCPVLIAPAMDVDMWLHSSTQRNIDQLIKDQVNILKVEEGELASGLSGAGRMAEPETILTAVEEIITPKFPVIEKLHVLITAGPTYESFDPVRYVGNWSTGKMGIAIAEQFYLRGAKVTLIQGPGNLKPRFDGIKIVKVKSAEQMHQACLTVWPDCQVGVFAAAVADYKPKTYFEEKISKKENSLLIDLERTKDIAAELGRKKQKNQLLVGFAMETENEINNAQKKLDKKNLDLIVLNSLKDADSGFGTDTNKVTFISNSGMIDKKPLKSKLGVAADIVNYVANNIQA